MLERLHSFEEAFFGCPSIGYQKASSERKETGKKRGIKDQTEDFDQKGTAGNRVEKPRDCFRSDQSGQSSLRQSCQQGNNHAQHSLSLAIAAVALSKPRCDRLIPIRFPA
jgi:hypothetical protein